MCLPQTADENTLVLIKKTHLHRHFTWIYYETYIGIIPYRTVAEMRAVPVMSWQTSCMGNTADVQWLKCLPKGSQLIHWTCVVFFHIARKWTPLFCIYHEWLRCCAGKCGSMIWFLVCKGNTSKWTNFGRMLAVCGGCWLYPWLDVI